MPASLLVPSSFRQFTGTEKHLSVTGQTVGEALADATHRFPGLKPHLYGETGQLRGFVSIFVNSTNVRDLLGFDTRVVNGDRIAIVPTIAGG